MKKKAIPYLIEAGIALAAALLVAWHRGVFSAADRAQILGGLCDAFFVPGALLVCFGLLAYCARGGVFDIFSYGAKSLKVLFTPFGKGRHQRYYDYKLQKEANRGKPRPFTLYLGLFFIAAAAVCLVMYNQAA